MTKINLILAAAVAVTGFTACNNASTETAKQDAVNLNNYVDSVENLTPVYTVANWSALDNGYQEKALQAEKTVATLEAADKAKLEESKAKYAALKAKYEAKLKENEMEAKTAATTPDYRQVLRTKLFGEGKVGADMKFESVTADNILGVYKNFVNTVADNKDSYTREDWDEIKVLYEALDTRKNVVEKDLSGSDNLKIAGLKIKFASIKATHRGGTKGAENAAAKEQ
ncbi:hypothetical protein [Ferruginibacter profundus]